MTFPRSIVKSKDTSDADFELDGSKTERTLLETGMSVYCPVYSPFRVRDGSKAPILLQYRALFMFYFHGTVNCRIWVIKLRMLHRVKLMAVITMTRQCHVVWVRIILRSPFMDYRCNGKSIHFHFIDAFSVLRNKKEEKKINLSMRAVQVMFQF